MQGSLQVIETAPNGTLSIPIERLKATQFVYPKENYIATTINQQYILWMYLAKTHPTK